MRRLIFLCLESALVGPHQSVVSLLQDWLVEFFDNTVNSHGIRCSLRPGVIRVAGAVVHFQVQQVYEVYGMQVRYFVDKNIILMGGTAAIGVAEKMFFLDE